MLQKHLKIAVLLLILLSILYAKWKHKHHQYHSNNTVYYGKGESPHSIF